MHLVNVKNYTNLDKEINKLFIIHTLNLTFRVRRQAVEVSLIT